MADPWNFVGESVTLGVPGGTVTLVEGSAFCISGRSGDMAPGSPQGLFFLDTRILSRLEMKVNGQAPEPLAASAPEPFSAVFVSRSRPRPGRADSALLIFRHRYIGRGLREDIRIRNFAEEASYCALEVAFDADFADLFEVKEGRASGGGHPDIVVLENGVLFRVRRGTSRRGVKVTFATPVRVVGNRASFEFVVPPRGEWTTCIEVASSIDDDEIAPRYQCGKPVGAATPVQRLDRWRRQTPILETDDEGLRQAVSRSLDDLGALRIFDPEFPERTVVAAGAPWFMTIFGRDSLITAWMALLADPDLALGVLQTLARFQGEEVDHRTEEEPGRILHEMRFGEASSLSLGGGKVYYGSADATPLFVMLLGELRRWGLAPHVVDQLLPYADRALGWVEKFGDRDGDGYVEYQRASDRGLINQGWKDSWDAIRFDDGSLARPPIALCEVQGYVYSAYVARYHFAQEQGDAPTAQKYHDKAMALKEAFNRDFWLDDRGYYALALDRDKRPVDALASNMGHCLWTGIIDPSKAPLVAARLMSPELFSGWGIRTLSTANAGFNPLSYHCGSVWPHDNALIASGLMRYGFVEEAHRVIRSLIAAGTGDGGRLPELFSGLERGEFPSVVSYPTSCSPQAWAAGSPLMFLRTILRLDPWVPHNKVWIAPVVPEGIRYLHVHRIPLHGARVSVEVEDGSVKVEGLPRELELITDPRAPLTAG
ncbi:MAG: amylo-alpha-1,6-glucosidase [Acidimicrobiales bacterium]